MNKGIRIYIILAALFAVCSCQRGELHFKIRFEDNDGLKAGDGIVFEENMIGKVEKVVYTREGDYLVEASVQHNFTNSVTRDSQFYIANNPRSEETKVIEIIQKNAGGVVLSDGEIVTGSVKPTIFEHLFGGLQKEARRNQEQLEKHFEKLKKTLQQSSQGLEDALDELAEQFSTLSEKSEKVPDSQEVKKLGETLDLLAEELEQSQKAIREKIQNEVIPEIQERLNKLRERLERHNRQNEIDPLDHQLNEMRKT